MLETYRLMQLIRRVEVASDQLYKRKEIRGFLHLYNGQEAVCAGMELALRREDAIITAYRDHGWFIGRGGQPEPLFAEMLGKVRACVRCVASWRVPLASLH
jgi:pyruvate dehydrogenase E1 component alpha subunit